MITKHILRYRGIGLNISCLSTITARFYSPDRGDRSSKPLRILFCGSDQFSCHSLVALCQEQRRDPHGILSIDVLCRPGKPSGRSLKVIREVPIKEVALNLGLTVHERDTFTRWDLPTHGLEPINLIIAVSFGLFVPPRILKSAEYGGINVHPSLLPNFRGPAPLQHAIIHGVKDTGVTLQTLDDKSFDHGTILDQRVVPIPGDIYGSLSYSTLLDLISPVAADVLVNGVRERLFAPPLKHFPLPETPEELIHAPKIRPEDSEVDWQSWPAMAIQRRWQALGGLWNNVCVNANSTTRVKFECVTLVPDPPLFNRSHQKGMSLLQPLPDSCDMSNVKFMVVKAKTGDRFPLFYIDDGSCIVVLAKEGSLKITHITVAGMRKKMASAAAESLRGDKSWQLVSNTQGPCRVVEVVSSQ